MTYGQGPAPRILRVGVAAGVVMLALTLSACSSSSHTPAGGSASASSTSSASPSPSAVATSTGASPSPSAAPGSGTSVAPTTPASPTSSPTPTKTKVVTSGFVKAQAAWKKGATVASADQGTYWNAAAADLKAGEATDKGDVSFYPHVIDDLKNLIALPETNQTPAQNSAFKGDVMTLNGFFQTPGLYQ